MALSLLASSAAVAQAPQLTKNNIDQVLKAMTLEEKATLLVGGEYDFWSTTAIAGNSSRTVPGAAGSSVAIERLGIPETVLTDGPAGVRIDAHRAGTEKTYFATGFPVGTCLASTWNTELVNQVGKAIGNETKEYNCDVILGPGVNIHRNPLCGRNFEYYSEDPYQAGKLATAFIHGVQGMGIGVSLKHFACNNQEYKRQNGNSIVDQRAFHEIYLKPFEIAVKQAKPSTVMCSYNQINGVYSSDNKELLTDILRKDWGFDGLVMTDWGALVDRIKAFKAGCDLNMPGGSKYMEKAAFKAVKSGQLSEEDINKSVERILVEVEKGVNHRKDYTFDREEQHNLAKQIALEGAVLLKNDGILPLPTESSTECKNCNKVTNG